MICSPFYTISSNTEYITPAEMFRFCDIRRYSYQVAAATCYL